MTRLKRAVVIAAWIAMLAQAVFWVVSAVLRTVNVSGTMDAVLAVLMLADGVAFAVLACLLKKRWLLLKIATLSFLLVNLALTVTDQMGVYDWIVLALNGIAAGSVMVLYLPTRMNSDQ